MKIQGMLVDLYRKHIYHMRLKIRYVERDKILLFVNKLSPVSRNIAIPLGLFMAANYQWLNSQAFMNHSEFTIIHPKWVLLPPIV